MADDATSTQQARIDAIRRERDHLAEHIRLGRETITRAQALIERLDAMLTNLDPPVR
jgi:uncharacterized Zn finger protein